MSNANTASAETLLARPTCTVSEAAIVLGISRDSAYRACRAGQIETLRLGKRLVVPTALLRLKLGLDGTAPTQTSSVRRD